MTNCGCLPGTYENGWHEIRCEECVAEERAAWERALDWYKTNSDAIIADIRRRNDAETQT